MASHRKPPPGGIGGTGIRTPALATAAFTSVAVLSQTAEVAPAVDGRPTLEEIEKKVDEFYRRADAATEEEPAGRQQGRRDARGEESVRRPGRLAKAREGLGSLAAAPDTADLLAEYPQDHFAPQRVMNRLASRVKGATERGKAQAAPETPAASPYDVKTAKARVQEKLALARELLSRLTAQENRRLAGIEQRNRAQAARLTAGPELRQIPAARQETGSPATGSTDSPATGPLGSPTTGSTDSPTTGPAGSPSAASAGSSSTGFAGSSATTSAGSSATTSAGSSATASAGSSATGSVGSYATRADKAVAFARAQVGKPYVCGASGPGSYDCSGLTQAAWKAAGVTLPRSGRDQAHVGTRVPLSEARPGDLVFFHGDGGHVGLCTGDGMMIHAPKPGAYVREESVYHGGESIIHSVVRPA